MLIEQEEPAPAAAVQNAEGDKAKADKSAQTTETVKTFRKNTFDILILLSQNRFVFFNCKFRTITDLIDNEQVIEQMAGPGATIMSE